MAREYEYYCKKCGHRETRTEHICVPHKSLVCCNESMIREWGTSMNITQVRGFCGKS